MKAEILKIAGVKSEKEFYKKFPTEEAFMKAHGKDFKKAKLGKAMPSAQYGCRGQSCTQTGEGIKKVGSRLGLDKSSGAGGVDPSFIDYTALNAPLSWEELQKFNETDPKSKEFKTYFKALKSRYPDLTVAQLLAAGGDSARINLRKQNLERYDQPSEQTFDKAYHPFYRFLMDQPQRVTIPQVLEAQPGGYTGFEQNVKSNYGKKKGKEGKQVKKLKQLTSYEGDIDGIVPRAQNGTNECGEGMIWDESVQMCVQDTGYRPVQSFNVNPNLSTGASNIGQNPTIMTNVNPFWAQSQFGGGAAQAGMPAGMVNPTPPPTALTGPLPGYISNPGALIGGVQKSLRNLPLPGATSVTKAAGNTDFLGKMGGPAGIANFAGDVIQGIDQMKEEKRTKEAAKQQYEVSKVSLDASKTRPEIIKRKYTRPEDVIIQPEQMFPTYGVGTNILSAEDGAQIGGNPTELQNMYNPGDLYSNLEFEPLNDSTRLKQYEIGGMTPMAQGGYSLSLGETMNTGGGKIGGAIGEKFGGPLGKLAGQFIGGVLFSKNAAEAKKYKMDTQQNIGAMAAQNFGKSMQNQFSSYMEHGGWVSHDWQPQVIAKFGEHNMSDLLRSDPTMDTLRSGGHIRQNNMSPVDQYGFGGELQTTWGGYAEPISQNPYLPGTGETVMFRGKSHSERDGKGRTGIGVKYGNSDEYSPYMEYGKDGIEDVTDVEVERGEPAIEMIDPKTGEKNMVVLGNLKIPNKFLGEIGDPKAKGKKFKHYVAGLSKQEAKQNKTIDKSIKQLIDLDLHTSIDKLKFSGLQANIFGANMKLKDIADKKTNASIVQNAINETAEEYGLDADSLAKGKYKIDKELMNQQAKFGKSIPQAQKGYKSKYGIKPWGGNKYGLKEKTKSPFSAKEWDDILDNLGFTGHGNKEAQEFLLNDPRTKDIVMKRHRDLYGKDPWIDSKLGYGWASEDLKKIQKIYPRPKKGSIASVTVGPIDIETVKPKPVPPLKRNPWIDAANMLIPYLLPTDQEPLDPTQLYGEMYALSSNQLEPVRAQGYRPQLLTPYDISLQDQLNEVTAQTRQAERLAGSDPAAIAAISAQANRAKSQILGEQFRQNQAQRMGVYNQNINTLNQAQLQNLGIFDQQFVRQEQAKSNTKAVTQAALNSISDKIARNKLENRTLGVMENMYNYRFDRRGRAINMNPLVQYDVTAGGSTGRTGTGGINPDYEFTYDANGQIIGTRKKSKDDTGKNGKKVEKSRNGNIVKAIKNL